MAELSPLPSEVLPAGVRARFVPGINGLRMHVLEAGTAGPGRPAVLLLHGFPELAYSWRKIMPALASAGFHVFAPDQRGYGRTTGWSANYDDDLRPFRVLNVVRDALGLVAALGYRSITAVVGHDFGASIAAWCALVRPDVFRSVALMSAPFSGPPDLPFDTERRPPAVPASPTIHEALAALPRPRKHYQWWYSTRAANERMWHCPQGVHDFLRAYFHHKSACRWLPDAELAVYAGEYQREGFQGGLNWYRARSGGEFESELQLFAGRTIDVPSIFISGSSDWGVYQRPGALERMPDTACTRFAGSHLLEGAGHWVQQEQAPRVGELLLDFLKAPAA